MCGREGNRYLAVYWFLMVTCVTGTAVDPPSQPRITGQKPSYKTGEWIILTCSSDDPGHPPATYTWYENGRQIGIGNRWTKYVYPQDDGREISCHATNRYTRTENIVRAAQLKLVVHYPPRPHDMSLHGYTRGQVLYEGDQHNVTCSATGGNPPVSYVTPTCQDQSSTENSGRLTFTVKRTDKGCTCTAHPPSGAKWEAVTGATTSLTVYTSPSEPKITTYYYRPPYKAGDTARLKCSSSDPGNPPAQYVWSYAARDNVRTYGYRSYQLKIRSLTWRDNGLEIQCRARNNYTDTKGRNLNASYTLEVFYAPRLQFKPLADNECVDVSSGECTVVEGQRVHVNCSASASNPTIDTISWGRHSTNSVLDFTTNRSHDKAEFTCEAATQTDITANLRDPLKRSKPLLVLVRYDPSPPVLTMWQSRLGDVTKSSVKEKDRVTVTCVGKDNPKPRLQLLKADEPTESLQTRESYSTRQKDDETEVWHTLQEVQCEDAGLYSCVAITDTLNVTTQASLYVKCSPRLANSTTPQPMNITYGGSREQLTFDVIAYPLPKVSVAVDDLPALRGISTTTQPVVSLDKISGSCEETDAVHIVRCTVWVQDVTSDDEGLYTIRLENTVAQMKEDLKMQLFVEGETEDDVTTDEPISIGSTTDVRGLMAIAGGFGVVVVVVGMVVAAKRAA